VRSDVSISIISYKTPEALAHCLLSVFHGSQGLRLEVIVVDNASSDGSVEMVRRQFPQVTVIENRRNEFFTRAHNQALRLASGRFVMILNSDTYLNHGTLTTLVDFLENHPKAGAVGCTIRRRDGTMSLNGWRFHSIHSQLALHWAWRRFPRMLRIFQRQYLTDWDRKTSRPVDVVSDACLMVRAEVLQDVGLYDEKYSLYFTEDDICQRIWKAGWEVWYVAEAEIMHLHRESTRNITQTLMWWISLKDTVRYFWTYRPKYTAVLLALFLIIDFVAKSAFHMAGNAVRRMIA
jgi:GT2 family glycosyltransferase